ncbi:site-specific integrase [Hyphomonas sp. ND6WE1B]|uniref:tyrosine-type recombinase/integrase n=1 Tax=Hyphomonas sp. ND6WE1B TaxID=1848191 RepID=UPI0008076247|nr:site-specific integrase [Hyphomonas sp. ND6WE1B]
MAELSDNLIAEAIPRDKQYKLFDSETPGLYILIRPSGSKTWRHREKIDGKERIRTLGQWKGRKAGSGLTLAQAREVCAGVRAGESEVPFRRVAEQWLESTAPQRTASTTRLIRKRLDTYAFPAIGSRPIGDIRAREVLDIVEGLRRKGKYETAQRVLGYMTQIFSRACVEYELNFNPASEVRNLKLSRPGTEHRAAATMAELGKVLADMDGLTRGLNTARALEFLILTASRTGEVRFADWSEFSGLDKPDGARWDIPPERMKMQRPHRVYLSDAAVDVLRRQAGDSWPRSGLVFPKGRKAMSENAMLYSLYRRGWKGKITVHGFRGTFSTHCNESGQSPDIVESCLAHEERNSVRRAYNHATYEPARRKLMEWWAKEVMRSKRKAKLL